MTDAKRRSLIEKIHQHKLPCAGGFVSAIIIDGPWKGYRIAEAMALSQLGAGPKTDSQ